MKRVVGMVVLGIGGFVAAIALTVGALALAGGDVGNVVQPTVTTSLPGEPTRTPGPSREPGRGSETPSPSADDHGGTGSNDPAGSDDTSGPGSSNSGSGSVDSGSGSDDSGSGHDDD